jgi:hypothetical protein
MSFLLKLNPIAARSTLLGRSEFIPFSALVAPFASRRKLAAKAGEATASDVQMHGAVPRQALAQAPVPSAFVS